MRQTGARHCIVYAVLPTSRLMAYVQLEGFTLNAFQKIKTEQPVLNLNWLLSGRKTISWISTTCQSKEQTDTDGSQLLPGPGPGKHAVFTAPTDPVGVTSTSSNIGLTSWLTCSPHVC